MVVEINFIALIAATATIMVLGALWYSPLLFGNAWMACIGKTKETLGSPTGPMIGSVLASLLSAFGLMLLMAWTGAESLSQALMLGGLLGIFIVFPALLSDNLFCGWGIRLLLIQSGYRILSLLLAATAIHFL